ncbi:MAG TPA: serine/threonine-protein kinase, partial [Myxococcota bacterium]|nr:serine/threonine-protein kinase [Myxococcota bacterium]
MRVCVQCRRPVADEDSSCPADGAETRDEAVLPEGTRLGAYRVRGVLGKGGMGVVYEALHETLNKRTAVKILPKRLALSGDFLERFVREAQAASRVEHPAIIKVYDFGRTPDGSAYMVMELLEGRVLLDAIRATGGAGLPLPLALHVANETAQALAIAHQKGIVHRDFKPGNVFLCAPESERPAVKVLDFGIALLHETGAPRLTAVGALMGTPHFMSPEQALSQGADARSDVYAWGCVVLYMTTGVLPFPYKKMQEILQAHVSEPPPAPSQRNPVLPPELDAIVLRCMHKEPAARFQSMREAVAALAPLAGDGRVPGMVTLDLSVPADFVRGAPAGAGSGAAGAAGAEATPGASRPAGGGRSARWLALAAVAVVVAGAAVTWAALGGGGDARDDDGDRGRHDGRAAAAAATGSGGARAHGGGSGAGGAAGDTKPGETSAGAGPPDAPAASVPATLAERAHALLRDALAGAEPAERNEALGALADAPSARGAELASHLVRAAPAGDCAAALMALGRARSTVFLPVLRLGLAREEEAVKLAAATQLARAGDDAGKALLAPALALGDADALVAALALAAVGERAGLDRLRAIVGGKSAGLHPALLAEARARLAAGGDVAARAALRGQARTGAPLDRLVAAEALLRIGDLAGRAALVEMLAAPEGGVRVAAARSLAGA